MKRWIARIRIWWLNRRTYAFIQDGAYYLSHYSRAEYMRTERKFARLINKRNELADKYKLKAHPNSAEVG